MQRVLGNATPPRGRCCHESFAICNRPTLPKPARRDEYGGVNTTASHAPRRDGTIAGLVSLGTALGVASLTAAVAKVDGPVVAVGNRFIDATPKWLKTFAIDTFGTSDKAVLLSGIAVVLIAAAVIVGRLAAKRFRAAIIGSAVLMALGILAAVTRTASRGLDWMPPVVGSLAGLGAFWLLLRRPIRTSATAAEPAPMTDMKSRAEPMPKNRKALADAFDRRKFIGNAVALTAVSGGLALTGSAVRRSRVQKVITKARAIGLPKAASAAPSNIGGASIGNGVAAFVPPTSEYYRIDTALSIPSVDTSTWKIKVQGMVDNPFTITYDELLAMPMIERYITLSCVSNEVGGDLLGNAKWLGVPLKDILKKAGVKPGATQLASKSIDGWTCGFPTELAVDGRDAMIAIGMNDEPLVPLHGFPARLVVPGIYGYVSATKWLTEINLTTMEAFDGYWIPRGWAKLAPIKTQSRIDVPRDRATVPAGRTAVAGVAWAMHRGISQVEVKVDDGDWTRVRMADEVSVDAWRQWVYEWDATPGKHVIAVRSTDGTGAVQTGEQAPPDPDGATGWHTIRVTVT
jgi:DMSO/TMAO reductase YedYZ molybdopterin-dependent catalytic subunit